uniref:Myb/SANT-like DNA-binding domain-containing protein n=1 Tax=Salvator merianae TaxID=96440 RepID=A0A8D0BD77_SALMN
MMHLGFLWQSPSCTPGPDGISQQEGQSKDELPGVPGKLPGVPQEAATETLQAVSLRKQRAVNWGEKETRTFLSIWGDQHVQKMLQQQYRNEDVYKRIAAEMAAMGYNRDWEQCRQRAKDLRRGYKDIKDQNRRSGRGRQVWQYFEELDAILGPLFELGNGYDGEDGADDLGVETCLRGSGETYCGSFAEYVEWNPNGIWTKGLSEEMDDDQMVFQRAANWGEKETRDFLAIWGHKKVQRLLHQQHWNEDIYKEVSAEMVALGYNRDWEQCRQRAKDLQRGYKDIKSRSRHSARGRKVWQYFEELDAILGQGVQVPCDPSSMQNWRDDSMDDSSEGLSTENVSPLVVQDSDQIDAMLDPGEEVEGTPTPCQRAAKWGEKETRDFLSIWGQDCIQCLLHQQHRNEAVYKKIAAEMTSLGYERDWEQCRQRAKDLRRGYRETRDHNRHSGRGRQIWQYFEELDVILRRWCEVSSGHTEEVEVLDGGGCVDICNQGSPEHSVSSHSWTTSPAEALNLPVPQALQLNKLADNSQMECHGSHMPGQRAARWGERETRDFLCIWGNENMQSQLRQQYRNEEVYRQIANQMVTLGYVRDWEQCRQRAKDLRRGYRDAKDRNRCYSRGRQVWQYFEELDAILGHCSDKSNGDSKGGKTEDVTFIGLGTKGSVSPRVPCYIPAPILIETQPQEPEQLILGLPSDQPTSGSQHLRTCYSPQKRSRGKAFQDLTTETKRRLLL